MSEHIVNTGGAAIHLTDDGVTEPALIFIIGAARHERGEALLTGWAKRDA